MTRTRRSIYSLIATYMNTATSLVVGLVATPLLLDWLGDERVGITRLAQQWFGYALLLGLGLETALSAHFSKAASTGDRALMLATIRGGIRAYVHLAFIAALWIGVLELFAPTLFNVQNQELLHELRIGLVFVAIGQAAVLFSAFKALADAEQRGYVGQICLSIASWTSVGVSLFLAARGGGLAGQFFALSIAPIMSGLLMAIDGVRRYPELLKHPRGQAVILIGSFPVMMLALQLCSRLSFYSDSIIIGLILSPELVVPFTSTQALMGLLQGIVFGIGNATWAALADLHHRGERAAFDRRLTQLTRFVSIFACALLVPAAAWNRAFVVTWVKYPERFAGDLFSYVAAASSIIICVTTLWGWPIFTTNRVRKIFVYQLAGGAINIVVSVVGTFWFGLLGPPLGTLVNLIAVLFWCYPLVIQREFGTSARGLLAAAAGPWLLAVPYGVLLALAANSCPLDDWIPNRMARLAAIAAILGVSAVAFLAVSLRLLISAEDRREWLQRLFPQRFPAP